MDGLKSLRTFVADDGRSPKSTNVPVLMYVTSSTGPSRRDGDRSLMVLKRSSTVDDTPSSVAVGPPVEDLSSPRLQVSQPQLPPLWIGECSLTQVNLNPGFAAENRFYLQQRGLTALQGRAGVVALCGPPAGPQQTLQDGLVSTTTTLPPPSMAPSPSPASNSDGRLFCGDCSISLASSESFFNHWLQNHCQPQGAVVQAVVVPLDDPESSAEAMDVVETEVAAADPNAAVPADLKGPPEVLTTVECQLQRQLVMERCRVCNHVYVQGTERYLQHAMGCCLHPSAGRDAAQTVSDLENPAVSALRVETAAADHHQSPSAGHVAPSSLMSPLQLPVKFSPSPLVPGGVSTATTTTSKNNCVCGTCNSLVRTVTSYFLHWLEHHRVRQEDSSSASTCEGDHNILHEVWQCKACPANVSRLFPGRQSVLDHVRTCHRDQKNFVDDADGGNLKNGGSGTGFPDSVPPEAATMVWSRQRRLKSISSDATFLSGVMSSSAASPHKPIRLATGALAATTKPDKLLSASKPHPAPVKPRGGPATTKQTTAGGAITHRHSPTTDLKKRPPGPGRQKLGGADSAASLHQGGLSKDAVAVASKFSLQADGSFRCVKCRNAFMNEKVMEKHYAANHEFQCKFCDLVMDKDYYGAHLRQHLAKERLSKSSRGGVVQPDGGNVMAVSRPAAASFQQLPKNSHQFRL